MPKFSGKIEHWIAFWEEYQHAVDNKSDMDDCTKLVYLKQAILDRGLKSTIADLGIQEKSYAAAVKLLKNRFNKPRIIHRQCCEAIKAISPNDNTRISLTKMADNVQHILTGLTRLESLEILTSMTELAMNKELKHLWLNHTSKITTTPPVEDLIAFIREKADQAEGEVTAPTKPPERHKNKSTHHRSGKGFSNVTTAPTAAIPTAAPVSVSTSAPVSQRRGAPQAGRTAYPPCKYSCPLCPENYYPYHCEVFKSYSTAQRKEHVRLHSLCTNCLKAGHLPADCRSTYKCKTCRGNHNYLIHDDQPAVSTPTSAASHPTVASTYTTQEEDESLNLPDCLLMTSQVLITCPTGTTMVARALLDSGSTLSIISSRTRKILELSNLGSSVRIKGVGLTAETTLCPLVRLTLSSSYQKDWTQGLTVAVMNKVTRNIPIKDASSVRDLPHLQDIHLADEHFDLPGPIDLLLGQDVWQKLFLPGESTSPQGTPAAWHTVFGWVILGQYTPDHPVHAVVATAQVVSSSKAQQESDDLLAKFWELEEPPQNDNLFTPEEQRVEQHYQDTHVYLPDEKRYQVKLPRTVGNLQLGESKTQAINRARSNERSLIRKQSWPAFQTFIQEYLELGHAQPVSPDDLLLPSSACYYMPIHSVYKQSSSTTKVRAVFDAIAKSTSQISLNDQLAVGPTIQPTLEQTLLRFRTYAVAVSGDISKMYREVVLAPEERSFHRFAAPTDPWREFQMNRVTFGVTASPYLAVKTLQQVARDFGSSLPQASYHIENSFYVDDFFGGADNPQEAIALQEDTRSILSHAGFQLRKWRSSSSKVLEKIPSEILEPLPNQELVDTHSASYPKALGLIWDSREDTMATSVELPTAYSSTKRGVVSDIARTFDILGWLSPVILPMKVLYRELWVKKLDWDQEVPDELKQQHEKWRSELHLLVEVRMPRHYFNKRKPLTVSLHGFSDVSKLAFAGVFISEPPIHQALHHHFL